MLVRKPIGRVVEGVDLRLRIGPRPVRYILKIARLRRAGVPGRPGWRKCPVRPLSSGKCGGQQCERDCYTQYPHGAFPESPSRAARAVFLVGQCPRSVTFGFFAKQTFHLHVPSSSASIVPRSIHSANVPSRITRNPPFPVARVVRLAPCFTRLTRP